ncbi:hypothetical protein ACLMJK_007802 [Lecanora helva]
MPSGNEPELWDRLNAQHLLWKEQLGYVVHPRIPIKEKMMIADVGTGTGIWPIQASKTLPRSAELHGYDIDMTKFPPKPWLPHNVFGATWDAFSAVPPAMVGRYDIVHISIFMLVVAKNNPLPLLKNLIEMLKPGGYVQWDELDWATKRIVQANPSNSTKEVQALLDHVAQWEDPLGPFEWIADLPNIYAKQGLEKTAFDRFQMAPAYLRYDTDKFLASYEEFSHTILDAKGGNDGKHLRELVSKASQESQTGVATTADMIVAVARKPVS